MTTTLALTLLPAVSTAVNTTVESPIEKLVGASFETEIEASTLSVAVASPKNSTRAVSVASIPAPEVATKLLPAGTVSVGAA